MLDSPSPGFVVEPEGSLVGGASPGALAWRRFRKHRLAMAGLVFLLLLGVAVVFLPYLYTVDPNHVDPRQFRRGPSPDHLLGTDSAGRDVFARLIVGGRVSLLVGITAALGATMLGALLGAASGYFRGKTDTVLARLADVAIAFPSVIAVIIVVAFLGQSVALLVVVVILLEWTGTYRVIRGLTLSLRERDSILAVGGLGAGPWRVLRRHILPAVLTPLAVVATLLVANVIMLEAGLSFLGLGVPPPTASWGNMLNEAQSLTILETMPWLWLPPGLAISATVIAVNFVGDGLRDAADPTQAR